MAIRFIPFGAWPADHPRTKSRKTSPSKLTSARLMREIESEIQRVGGKNASVECALSADQLRRDGLFYAGKAPSDPGLILRFTDKSGRAIAMPSDRYTTVEGNLFGLYKTLEALRAVDRHGCALSGEQYTGWAKLSSGSPPAPQRMTLDEACAIIIRECDRKQRLTDDEMEEVMVLMQRRAGIVTEQYVRNARSRAHPDAGGSTERFQRIQDAVSILAAHHGVEDL